MTGRTTTPRGDGVTRHNFATGNKISYCNSTNSVVLSVENGCGGHQTRECISFPCGKGEAVSEKLANDHLGSMGPELCERLRDRLGGAAITDSNAKRTGVLKDRSRLPLTGSGEPCAEGGDIRDIYADQRDVKRERLCLSAICSPKEGRRHQTSCEPKGSQFVRQAGILQNGRNTSAERSPLPRRLDDESRSERCVLRHSPQLRGQETPEVPMARETVSVQLPTIRTVVGSVDLYQGHKASGDYSQNPGHENYHLHRRHPGHGTKQRNCSAAHRLPDFLAGELGVHHQSAEISDRPLARDRILGSHCRLHPNGAPTTGFKDQEHSVRCQDSAASKSTYGSGSVEVTGKVNPCNSRNEGCPPLLQASSVMPSCRPATDAGLHSTLPSDGRGKRGIVMVGHSPNVLEWEIHPSRQSGSHNRDGRLPNWLGSPLRKPPDGRTMVPQRSSNAHQLPGTSGSNSGNSNLCQEEGECPHSLEDGQHVCPDIHQQDGWYGLTRPQSAHQRTLVLVPYQECHTSSLPPPRNSQQESGRGIQDHERSIRLDALPGNLSEHSSTAWSLRNRPVCVEADKTAPDVRELATRPRGSGDRCVLNELERTESLCQPAVEHDLPGLGSSQATGGNHCFGRSGVENSSMVLPAVDIAHPRAPPDTPDRGFDTTNPPNQLPKHTAPASRVAYLRAKFSAQRISPQASKLLLASWREKSGKTYDSLFRKWAGWCTERDIDPLSGDVTSVVNFLADLFHQGYQHRSLCSYRSAISSVHEPVDGQPIGSHPMVSRLLKGVFHERPPQPRYSTTWDVSVVTNHIESLGDNQDLTLADLTLKVVALLALTRPSRSVDLTNLDIRFRHFCPEGVTFHAAKLAKQSRQTKPVKEFFFPKFEQNKKLCPVLALQEYEKRTSEKRSSNGTLSTQLLIAMIKPHKPVSSSTVARWLKTVLNNAGIDTSIFKAHSVRSAATSSASEAGVTTATILDAADWATETVFQRFYYKPKHNTTFGHAVLSQLSTTDRRATNSR